MIINASIAGLLRDAPLLGIEWQERLYSWLKIIDGNEFPPVFEAQLQMIDALVETEREIQETDKQAVTLRKAIPEHKLKNEIEQVIDAQRKISALEDAIKGLQYRRHCILFLGDVMAIKLLDQDDIKHLSANQPAGFISGKSGLKAEVDAAKRFFSSGYMVIFNDLTHSLTMGDLTLRKGDEIRSFEVKSNPREYLSRETFRQISNPIVIHQYMKTDVTPVPVTVSDRHLKDLGFDSSKQEPAYAIRLDSNTVEKTHFHDVGKIFKQVYRAEVVELEINGKYYLASLRRNVGALRSKLEQLTNPGNWVVTNIRERVTGHRDLPPFGFWFKPQSSVEVMTGEVILLSAFSMDDLTNQFNAKQIKLAWKRRNGDIFPMSYEPQFAVESTFELHNKNLNQWHWLRVLYSFLSLETFVGYCTEWFSPEYLAQAEAKLKQIKKRKSTWLRARGKTLEEPDGRNPPLGESNSSLLGTQ